MSQKDDEIIKAIQRVDSGSRVEGSKECSEAKQELAEVTPEVREAMIQERREARERFGDLIRMVAERYEKIEDIEQRKAFNAHNEDVLDTVIELAMRLRPQLDLEALKQLELAAILHDMTKADDAPAEILEVEATMVNGDDPEKAKAYRGFSKQYVLVMHGETAAHEALKWLTDDYLETHGFAPSAELTGDPAAVKEYFQKVRQDVTGAIRQHMGPRPGFMAGMLAGVKSKLAEQGLPTIPDHPDAEGVISQALLAVDMRSLASKKGVEKVIAIRSAGTSKTNIFKKIDEQIVAVFNEIFHEEGVTLSMGEAAFLSAAQSAFDADKMAGADPRLAAWFKETTQESLERSQYEVGGEAIDSNAVMKQKWELYRVCVQEVQHRKVEADHQLALQREEMDRQTALTALRKTMPE